MKINDLEKILDVKRSSIFYYEREGLLAPRREENNYREYSEDDLRRLKTVVVLRKLGFTVEEIRALLDRDKALPDVLPGVIARLEAQAAELSEAADLCRAMDRQGVTMDSFDPDAWFETVEAREREGKRFLDLVDDVAEEATRTMAFLHERSGLVGPVFALFFLSEEGMKKRRLWKLYWILLAVNYVGYLAMPWLVPGHYTRLASPWAALVLTLVQGVIGSLVLWLCARYVIPGRKPRRALIMTVLIVVGVNLLLGVVWQQAARYEVDEEALDTWYKSGAGAEAYLGGDPVGYVQSAYNERYYGGQAELDVWQNDEEMFVFTSWGTVFRFRASGDGNWAEMYLNVATDCGLLYTADPYGPRAYPSRLMLTDGTVVEPVYEAHFSAGYIPLYVFDISLGQEYTGLEYGVDGTGAPRYGIDRTEYAGASVWEAPVDPNERKYQHTTAEVLAADGGAAFLDAFGTWRSAVWTAAPAAVLDSAGYGVESDFVLYVSRIAPPTLTVRPNSPGLPAQWGLNEYTEALLFSDQGARFRWTMTCEADVTALVMTDAVTPQQLLAAAATVQDELPEGSVPILGAVLGGDTIPYAESRVWSVTVPDSLCALGAQTFGDLNS